MERRTTQEIALKLAGQVSMAHLLLERARAEIPSVKGRKAHQNKLSNPRKRFTASVKELDGFPGAVQELNFFFSHLTAISPERVEKMIEDIAKVRDENENQSKRK